VKPDLARVLEVCAAQLLLEVAPQVQPPYRQASVAVTGVLLSAMREELDRVAERRIVENRTLRALFERALPVVRDAALAARLADAAASGDGSFRLSDLDAANAALRRLLIELHAHAEEIDDPEARRLEDAIWRELAASTERRRLSLGMF
jgi:hypothetical protein